MKYEIKDEELKEITQKTVEKYVIDSLKARDPQKQTWDSYITSVIWSVVNKKMEEMDIPKILISEVEKHVPESIKKYNAHINYIISENINELTIKAIREIIESRTDEEIENNLPALIDRIRYNLPNYIRQIMEERLNNKILEGIKKILFKELSQYIDFNKLLKSEEEKI